MNFLSQNTKILLCTIFIFVFFTTNTKKKITYLFKTINLEKQKINSAFELSWGPNNKYISTGDAIISIDTNKATEKNLDEIITFVPMHNYVITKSKIQKFNPTNGKIINTKNSTIPIPENFNTIHISPNGKTLGLIKFNNQENIILHEYPIDFNKNKYGDKKNITIKFPKDAYSQINYIPDYKYITSINLTKNTINIMNIKKKQLIGDIKLEGDYNFIKLIPKKNILLLIEGDKNSKIKIFKLKNKSYKLIKTIFLTDFPHHVFDISPDENILAIQNIKNIDIIDINSGSLIRKLIGHNEKIQDIKFSPDGKLIASLDNKSKKLKIWKNPIDKPNNKVSDYSKIETTN